MKDRVRYKLEQLNKDTEEMYVRIEGLTEEQLADDSYGWSILQTLSHLNEAEKLSLSYMRKKLQAGDKMGNSDFTHSFRMWFVNQVLKSSLKWKAPSYISNPPAYSKAVFKDYWEETRAAIRDFVEDYPEQYLKKLVYKHPMGGRQNLLNTIDSFIYHQRHHLHQIDRIKKKIGA